jgi:hypothetical protein
LSEVFDTRVTTLSYFINENKQLENPNRVHECIRLADARRGGARHSGLHRERLADHSFAAS